MKQHVVTKWLGAAILCGFAFGALARPLPLDVSGSASFGQVFDPGNVSTNLFAGAGSQITAVSWDVVLFADENLGNEGGSWLNEIRAYISNSSQSAGFVLQPADSTFQFPGTMTFRGSRVLDEFDTFAVDPDGLVRVEFFESFDDDLAVADGRWVSGSITLEVTASVVPEPSTKLLSLAGCVFAFLGFTRTAMRRHASRLD